MSTEPIESVLERVARLDREATPGPWAPATTESEDGAEQSACGPEHVLTFASDDEDDDELRDRELDLVQADAALIASYRTDAVTLAAEVVRLRAVVLHNATPWRQCESATPVGGCDCQRCLKHASTTRYTAQVAAESALAAERAKSGRLVALVEGFLRPLADDRIKRLDAIGDDSLIETLALEIELTPQRWRNLKAKIDAALADAEAPRGL